MKACPNCSNKYPDDANFCPQESCATDAGPRRLVLHEPVPERFRLGPRLGGGASGEVFRAVDGQTGAEVAYKLVTSGALPSPAAVDRAQRELKQLARAQSERVARVVDQGKTPDGRLWIAMELAPGEPLDEIVRRTGPMSFDRAKMITAQIGEALLEGQKVGVVHHDVAPKNVLVGPEDAVKVINFAVPRPVTDKVFGVPEFLSPEQAEGKPVDQRSNTYSLGAVLYFLLTGQPPYIAAEPRAVLDLHLRGELIPPSRRAPDAKLTGEIDRVVVKALEKSSSRRHLTLRQFLTEVDALGAGGTAAALAAGRDNSVGFAKTMMFSGNAGDVANLVAQVQAAKAEAAAVAAAPAPAPAPVAPSPPTPPPAVASPPAPNPAAVAATMVATPAMIDGMLPGASARTPPPVSSTPPPAAPAAASPPPAAMAATVAVTPAGHDRHTAPVHSEPQPTVEEPKVPDKPDKSAPKAGAGGAKPAAFRETLWFKKGDVEQMVAEAKAKAAATSSAAAGKAAKAGDVEPELPAEDVRPIEDRYIDDGSVTTEDRKKFSLRSGGTATAMPAVRGVVPGERMSESEMLNEIAGGKKTLIIVAAAVVVVILVVFLVISLARKKEDKPAAGQKTAASEVVPAPATKPVAAPGPAAPVGAALAAAAPAAPAPVAGAPKAGKKAAHAARVSHKRASPKKSSRERR